MHYCVAVSALVDNFHADPHIYIAENLLLVLLILASVVQKHTVQKLVVIDFS